MSSGKAQVQRPVADENQLVVLNQWSLDVNKIEEGALTVLKHVRPNWSPENVAFRPFTDGITSFEDPERQARFLRDIPSQSALQTELNEIVQKMESLKMPIVFSHNDLLLKNIIYNQEKKTIHFIDYEYAFLNYEAYDIGNHFCEYAGMGEVDYDLYPDKVYQMKWLRRYLQAKGRSSEEVTEEDVEVLYVQANVCACAAHFFWGLWALIQAKNSSIDFDFLGYGITRLNEYFHCKSRFFSLTLP